ncbi:MAG: NAD(P)-dependent oxidoreductase [Bacillota bacterium]
MTNRKRYRIALVGNMIHPCGMEILAQRAEVQQVFSISDVNPDTDAIIIRAGISTTVENLAACRRLKVIAMTGTGTDHIDPELLQRGIQVISAPGINAASVAEHTVALMLAVARKIPTFDSMVRMGQFGVREELRGVELRGKALGIVGLGAVGRYVARICQHGFGMQVHAYVGNHSSNMVNEMTEMGVRVYRNLTDVLKIVDVLTLHVPLNTETRRLIGIEELQLLPKRAILINTSRGGVW